MQLKFQRSQRAGGVLGNTIIFCLDARADYSQAEAANIAKYKLGGQVVYNSQAARRHLDNMGKHLNRVESDSMREQAGGLLRGVTSLALAKMQLNISIASLGRGHHIECKDLGELLDAEKALMDACRNLKGFLEAAATFSGSIILVDFDDGEKVHTSQGSLELAALPAPAGGSAPPNIAAQLPYRPTRSGSVFGAVREGMVALYRDNPRLIPILASVLVAILIMSFFNVNAPTIMLSAAVVGVTAVRAFGRANRAL